MIERVSSRNILHNFETLFVFLIFHTYEDTLCKRKKKHLDIKLPFLTVEKYPSPIDAISTRDSFSISICSMGTICGDFEHVCRSKQQSPGLA